MKLVDSFGRRITDLRISVTDRCNLRCTYCMPEAGLEWLPSSEQLEFHEIVRIASVAVERLGVESIRITGGEPLVRPHLDELVAALAALGVDLAMTTNATTLERHASRLREAGLHRVNVSLDAIDPKVYEEITRRSDLDAVVRGLEAARAAGFDPIKLNAVVMRGINESEILGLVEFARDRNYELRFIEFMPLDAHEAWSAADVVSGADILATIDSKFPLEPAVVRTDHQPAHRYAFRDGNGFVGVVPSVSAPFCGDCDRMRLTADGMLRACLFSLDEIDLKTLLRGGHDPEDIDQQIEMGFRTAAREKWAGHQIGNVEFRRPNRGMSQIGG